MLVKNIGSERKVDCSGCISTVIGCQGFYKCVFFIKKTTITIRRINILCCNNVKNNAT